MHGDMDTVARKEPLALTLTLMLALLTPSHSPEATTCRSSTKSFFCQGLPGLSAMRKDIFMWAEDFPVLNATQLAWPDPKTLVGADLLGKRQKGYSRVEKPTVCLITGHQGRKATLYPRTVVYEIIRLLSCGYDFYYSSRCRGIDAVFPHSSLFTPEQVAYVTNTLRIRIIPSMDDRSLKKIMEDGNVFLNEKFPITSPNDPTVEMFQDSPVTDNRERIIVKGVTDWLLEERCVLTIIFMTGTYLVTYPFDSSLNPAPDDDVFRWLAARFLKESAYRGGMPGLQLCQNLPPFYQPHGFQSLHTNGGRWKLTNGSLQDWLYLRTGGYVVTIYAVCALAREKSKFVTSDKERLVGDIETIMSLFFKVFQGVSGIITDVYTGRPLAGVRVTVVGREPVVWTTAEDGVYWRMLLKGNYTLRATKDGYPTTERELTVTCEPTEEEIRQYNVQCHMRLDFPMDGRRMTDKIIKKRDLTMRQPLQATSPGDRSCPGPTSCLLPVLSSGGSLLILMVGGWVLW